MVQQYRYTFLDNMKAIAIVMVVATHAIAFSADMPAAIKEKILISVLTIAVPVFFFIDGYLLATSHSAGKTISYWPFVKKNSHRLLLPWLIFSLGYCALRYIFESFDLLDDKHIVGQDIGHVIAGIYGSVYAAQMYFLVSLFLIRLIAPIISLVFNSSPLIVAILLGILCVVLQGVFDNEIYNAFYISGGQEPLTHAIWGLQFYIVGILAFRVASIIDTKWLLLSCGSFFIASCFFTTYGFFQLTFLVFFFLLLKYLNFENRIFRYVGSNTMGIYLLHSPLILKITSLCTDHLIDNSVVSFLLNTSITMMLTVFCVAFIERLGLSPYLFGEAKNKAAR